MRLLWCIYIEEKETRVCSIRIPNRPLATVFTVLQLVVSSASLSQHFYSFYKHGHVFLCRSNIPQNASWAVRFLAYDIIIFDFGLMRRTLGTNECVANYLDGGYMRFAWCIEQCSALLLCIGSLIYVSKYLFILWPGLLIQSSYSLGLSVLTMATAPKMLEALGGRVDLQLATQFGLYVLGFVFSWVYTFILWHHYWYLERLFTVARPRTPSQLSTPRTQRSTIAHV